MPLFEVLSNSVIVGYSDLEAGDPPMGVAMGKFVPVLAYKTIQAAVVACHDSEQSQLSLRVRLVDGLELPAEGGIQIIDYSAELGAAGIEVHVLGIGYPLYETLFPGHIAAYKAQFPKAG